MWGVGVRGGGEGGRVREREGNKRRCFFNGTFSLCEEQQKKNKKKKKKNKKTTNVAGCLLFAVV